MLDILIIVAWAATTVLFVAVAAAAAAGDVTIAVDPLEAQRHRERAVGHAEACGGLSPLGDDVAGDRRRATWASRARLRVTAQE
jgi:hypothetical protein